MILPFMPEGSHAILLNYRLTANKKLALGTERHDNAFRGRIECSSCSWTMEAGLWWHVRHVHKLYYQVWDGSDFASGTPGRDASVLVRLPRLGYLIRVALDAMKPL